jgi:hypothetical protein
VPYSKNLPFVKHIPAFFAIFLSYKARISPEKPMQPRPAMQLSIENRKFLPVARDQTMNNER